MGRLSRGEILRRLLRAELADVERMIQECVSDPSCSIDELVEIISGFMCERCDNMLANVERAGIKLRVFALAEACYSLFLKAHAGRRGYRVETSSVSSVRGLDESYAMLRGLLSTGEYRLVVMPREGYLFFKNYYPSSYDPEKLRKTVALLRGVVGLMKKYAGIREKYGEELESIDRVLRGLGGYAPLDVFLTGERGE
jgi:hypothetical protein